MTNMRGESFMNRRDTQTSTSRSTWSRNRRHRRGGALACADNARWRQSSHRWRHSALSAQTVFAQAISYRLPRDITDPPDVGAARNAVTPSSSNHAELQQNCVARRQHPGDTTRDKDLPRRIATHSSAQKLHTAAAPRTDRTESTQKRVAHSKFQQRQ